MELFGERFDESRETKGSKDWAQRATLSKAFRLEEVVCLSCRVEEVALVGSSIEEVKKGEKRLEFFMGG